MVFIRLDDEVLSERPDLGEELDGRGVRTRWNGPQSRLVTHLDVSAADIETAIDAFADLLA